ncbi:MAG: MarR family transcriptional regulator [Pseudomonadota bacterium]
MVDPKKVTPPPELAYDLIGAMFFGYRDFVGVADAALATTGYGRAHHRVLYFVDRRPGLTVGELLKILKISKQGVARVLKTLVDDGLITMTPGARDRREKNLATTPAGHALVVRLATLQSARIEAAVAAANPADRAAIKRFLTALVDPSETADVAAIIGAPTP